MSLLVAAAITGACSSVPDSVSRANEANRTAPGHPAAWQDAAEFLVDMADARMMDAREGQIAAERATRDEVREYGRTMVQDQAMLLAEINALAASKGIAVPNTISNAKADGLRGLESQTGDDVDERFIRMICIDHRRDVRRFREATDFADPEVRAFAREYLPLIEEHLRDIEAISDHDD